MIKKEHILSRTTTFAILDHFSKNYRQGGLRPGKNFQNPLINHTQETPSFNIYYSDTGQYMYKDYATGHCGTAFDFVMNKYGLSLPQACNYISQELQLGLEDETVEAEEQYVPEPKIEAEKRNYNFKTYPKPWSKYELEFWEQAGVDRPTLEKLCIRPLSRFWAYNRFNKQYEIKARYDNPMFEYVQNGWSKIYVPFAKYASKFYTLGRKDPHYIFGIDQLPLSDKRLVVTGGEKDAVAWIAHGGNAICFNSEEANPSEYPRFIELLISGRFEEICFIYDNDKTGIRQMKKMYDWFGLFGVTYKVLPQMPPYQSGKERKDLFDYFTLKREGADLVSL